LGRKRELIQKHRDIRKNEQSIYDRVATPRVQVFEWYEHAPRPCASALREALTGQQSIGKGKKGKAEWKRCSGSYPGNISDKNFEIFDGKIASGGGVW
jgi:hypothetical protein